MSILERTDGKWGSRIIIIDDQPRQPTKATTFKHFLNALKSNPNCMNTLTELVEAGKKGELPQYAIDEIINRVCGKKVR